MESPFQLKVDITTLQNPTTCCLQEINFKYKDTGQN